MMKLSEKPSSPEYDTCPSKIRIPSEHLQVYYLLASRKYDKFGPSKKIIMRSICARARDNWTSRVIFNGPLEWSDEEDRDVTIHAINNNNIQLALNCRAWFYFMEIAFFQLLTSESSIISTSLVDFWRKIPFLKYLPTELEQGSKECPKLYRKYSEHEAKKYNLNTLLKHKMENVNDAVKALLYLIKCTIDHEIGQVTASTIILGKSILALPIDLATRIFDSLLIYAFENEIHDLFIFVLVVLRSDSGPIVLPIKLIGRDKIPAIERMIDELMGLENINLYSKLFTVIKNMSNLIQTTSVIEKNRPMRLLMSRILCAAGPYSNFSDMLEYDPNIFIGELVRYWHKIHYEHLTVMRLIFKSNPYTFHRISTLSKLILRETISKLLLTNLVESLAIDIFSSEYERRESFDVIWTRVIPFFGSSLFTQETSPSKSREMVLEFINDDLFYMKCRDIIIHEYEWKLYQQSLKVPMRIRLFAEVTLTESDVAEQGVGQSPILDSETHNQTTLNIGKRDCCNQSELEIDPSSELSDECSLLSDSTIRNEKIDELKPTLVETFISPDESDASSLSTARVMEDHPEQNLENNKDEISIGNAFDQENHIPDSSVDELTSSSDDEIRQSESFGFIEGKKKKIPSNWVYKFTELNDDEVDEEVDSNLIDDHVKIGDELEHGSRAQSDHGLDQGVDLCVVDNLKETKDFSELRDEELDHRVDVDLEERNKQTGDCWQNRNLASSEEELDRGVELPIDNRETNTRSTSRSCGLFGFCISCFSKTIYNRIIGRKINRIFITAESEDS